MTAEEKINELISEKLGVPLDEISLESNFVDDLGADSLDIVELIMSLEELADIDVPDEDAETLTTVQAVHDYIKNKVGKEKWSSFDG